MSFIFGGGGGGGGSTSGTQTVTREAPGVEARKLSLYDEAARLASSPVSLPAVQVAPLSPTEQSWYSSSWSNRHWCIYSTSWYWCITNWYASSKYFTIF